VCVSAPRMEACGRHTATLRYGVADVGCQQKWGQSQCSCTRRGHGHHSRTYSRYQQHKHQPNQHSQHSPPSSPSPATAIASNTAYTAHCTAQPTASPAQPAQQQQHQHRQPASYNCGFGSFTTSSIATNTIARIVVQRMTKKTTNIYMSTQRQHAGLSSHPSIPAFRQPNRIPGYVPMWRKRRKENCVWNG
jgi:hypothetical protein